MESKKNTEKEPQQKLPQFEVPCEIANVKTTYKMLYSNFIGNTANFKIRYQSDAFGQTRQRYSAEYLAKQQNQIKFGQSQIKNQQTDGSYHDELSLENMFENDLGIFLICKNTSNQSGLVIVKDFLTEKIDTQDVAFNDSIKPTAIAVNKHMFRYPINKNGLHTDGIERKRSLPKDSQKSD